MERRIALLRGINVGGRRRVPMPDLRAALEAAGYAGVRTYVQSGNVVLDSSAPPAELGRDLGAIVAREFGHDDVPVLVRTAGELAAVVDDNPLAGVADGGKMQHVVFCDGEPRAGLLAELEAAATDQERVAIRGREIHVWYAGGMNNSKLARAITDRRVGATATDRNWRTVLALLDLARA